MNESFSFKLIEDLSINFDAIQSLSIEIWSIKSKNIISNTIYSPLYRELEKCENHFKNIFSKNGKNRKNIVLARDFNINFLDFETNNLNLMFRYNMIPLTSKPTQVNRHSENAIDHIITSSVKDHNDFKPAIIKTDLLDHVPIFFALISNETTQKSVVKSPYKCSYSEKKHWQI